MTYCFRPPIWPPTKKGRAGGSVGEMGLFDDFLLALLCLTDERGKEKPNAETINSWYEKARDLFRAAVREAVEAELQKVELAVVVGR